MNYIKCDGSTIVKLHNIFAKNNNYILDSLKRIGDEFFTVKLILDTPKANQGMVKIEEIMKENNEIISENGEKMERRFNEIVKAYEEYLEETKAEIGADHE